MKKAEAKAKKEGKTAPIHFVFGLTRGPWFDAPHQRPLDPRASHPIHADVPRILTTHIILAGRLVPSEVDAMTIFTDWKNSTRQLGLEGEPPEVVADGSITW